MLTVPIFKYECECGFKIKKLEKKSTEFINCPLCGNKAKRQFGNILIKFNGTDFYTTETKEKGEKYDE
jgi:predicted nucleic acid-binding Zn ribbon protein